MKKKSILLLLLFSVSSGSLFAQSSEFSLWGGWFYSQKLSQHWGVGGDLQFRSADKVDYLRNILIRPQVNYYLNKNQIISLGYAYITSYGRDAEGGKTFRPENRIFEQFTLAHKLCANTTLTHRFRLEQRFLGNTTNTNNSFFAQRLRYFVRGMVPFKKDSVFSKGAFVALQNEVFVNIQNKAKLNNNFFDQNRAYIAVGYRLNKKVDVEVGYMNQYTKGESINTVNNIAQVAVYTRF